MVHPASREPSPSEYREEFGAAATGVVVSDSSSARRGHLLSCFLVLPNSLEKSAHLLMLKHLCRLGWDVTVLTLQRDHLNPRAADVEQWHGIRIVRVDARNLRWRISRRLQAFRQKTSERELRIGGKLLPYCFQWILNRATRVAESAFGFPDSYYSAFGPLVAAADRLAVERPLDLVLSLYHPIASHALAKCIATRAERPWVALTKDYYSWPASLLTSLSARIVNLFKAWYEFRLLRSSRCVLAINDNIRDHLHALLPGHTIGTLAHCYDKEHFADPLPDKTEGTVFTLRSVGRVAWSEAEGLHLLFRAVSELIAERKIAPEHFRLCFVGHGGHIVRHVAKDYALGNVVKLTPPLPHGVAIENMRTADCLLFQQAPWGNRRRLPEYFATRKPVLAFPSYPGTMSERLLGQYGGARIADGVASLKATLKGWYEEFHNQGAVAVSIDDRFVDTFSAGARAVELDVIFRGLLNDDVRAIMSKAGASK